MLRWGRGFTNSVLAHILHDLNAGDAIVAGGYSIYRYLQALSRYNMPDRYSGDIDIFVRNPRAASMLRRNILNTFGPIESIEYQGDSIPEHYRNEYIHSVTKFPSLCIDVVTLLPDSEDRPFQDYVFSTFDLDICKIGYTPFSGNIRSDEFRTVIEDRVLDVSRANTRRKMKYTRLCERLNITTVE